MASQFTYTQECCFCAKRFKTFSALQKHVHRKHPEQVYPTKHITFWDNKDHVVGVPQIMPMDRRSKDYKDGYLTWLAGLTEQINASLHPCLRGRWFTISFPQVSKIYFGHFASQIGCNVHSMRQVPHRKSPLYSPSSKRVSYKVFSIAPFADALHEQTLIRFKDSILYSGNEKVERSASLNTLEELEAAKNRNFWSNANNGRPDKRATLKACLEVGPGEGRATREIELIWWPNLFTATNHGKLSIRFFVKKVSV